MNIILQLVLLIFYASTWTGMMGRCECDVCSCLTISFVLQKTHAHRRLKDDVPPDVKQRRHEEISTKVRQIYAELNQLDIGSVQLVLIESVS